MNPANVPPELIAAIKVVVATILVIGVMQALLSFIQLILAALALRESARIHDMGHLWPKSSSVAPPISILVPAHNEALTILTSVQALLDLSYPRFEVIVINDGSTDDTLAALRKHFRLEKSDRPHLEEAPHKPVRGVYMSETDRRLLVLDKENGGKADALNAGLNFTRTPLFCTVDADSILEPDSLLRTVQPFLDEPEEVIAVGGSVRIANGCTFDSGRIEKVGLARDPLSLLQTVEYLRAFLVARLAWSEVGALTLISGAFSIFRRSAAVDAGGYDTGTVGEDFELVMRMHRNQIDKGQPHKVVFIPEPVCWTEAPRTLGVLSRQRIRWQRGALETFFKHVDMFWKRRYGRINIATFLNTFVVDVVNPIVEVLGYVLVPLLWALGLLSVDYALAFLALTVGYGVFFSLTSLLLTEVELRRYPGPVDILILGLAAILENFGYRQLNNVWRVIGWWRFLRGVQGWGAMARQGFGKRAT